MQTETIKQLIEASLSNSQVLVEGDGAHFTAIVVSLAFVGKSRLERQQLINIAVKEQLLDGTLHALSIKTFTPDEWQQCKQT
ncbi:MAG TPA: BolA/IbaG family iron-sulfur metabolism protein [Gammaproteobacteria bacterium]|nr:BolA/IbaG family iron-sulfur metabolism protein [Gammaproteobacteria bacterium]